MIPFQKAPCPKCRAPKAQIRIRWCDESHSASFSHRKHCPRHAMNQSAPEHIHHTCPVCGYERVTRPADAPMERP